MTYCVSCGQALAQAASFCTNCGAKALPSEAVSSVSSVSRSSTVPAPILHASAAARTAVSRTLFVLPTGFVRPFSALMDKHLASPLALVADDNPVQLQSKVRIALKRLLASGEVKYVCVLGNWADVPAFRVRNPCVKSDVDECLTDALYGCVEPYDPDHEDSIFSVITAVPVGRIPTLELEVVASALLEAHHPLDPVQAFAFGVSAKHCLESVQAIVSQFTDMSGKASLVSESAMESVALSGVLCSPAWSEHDLRGANKGLQLKEGAVLLFKVHGSPEETSWYGKDTVEYTKIFSPDTIADFRHAVLVTEACHGGALGYDEPSIVEKFFLNGGKAFVGSSVIVYGNDFDPVAAGDLIALHFLKGLRLGLNFGDALNHAKAEAICVAPSYADDITRMAVMSFNLFGAPWHAMQVATAPPVRPVRSDRISVLDRVRSGRTGAPESPTGALEVIRQRYRSHLPVAQRLFLVQQDNILKQVTQFKDFGKIETFLSDMQVMLDDCELEILDFSDESFHRLSGGNASQMFMLVMDKHGQLINTFTTIGTS